MATHDYVLANQSGSSFRTDLNNALAAVVTGNSSGTEPSTKYAYMEWNDTSSGVKKIRNAANNAWIELFQLDGTLTMEDGAEATPGLAFRDDLNTGIWSSGADTLDISTGGTKRFTITTSGANLVGALECSDTGEYQIVLKDSNNSGAGAEMAIGFKDSGNTVQGWVGFNKWEDDDFHIANTNSGGHHIFETNNGSATAERLRIQADGDIEATGNLKTNNLFGHNLVINGAMRVAQRSTSKNTAGASGVVGTVDRMLLQIQSGTITESQQVLSSSDAPFASGFSYYMRLLNQSGIGAGAAQYLQIDHRIEAQDIEACGWDYTSSTSYITLSFWVRASVAQAYIGVLMTSDGTQRHYPFEIKDSGGSTLSANTWTKMSVTVPGNSGISINHDTGVGLTIQLIPYYGTNYTSSSGSLNTWNTTGGGTNRFPDMTTTWATTTNATFDITGLQLEIGSIATEFEHKSYGEELARCQRYFERIVVDASDVFFLGVNQFGSQGRIPLDFKVTKRAIPTVTIDDATFYYYNVAGSGSNGNSSFVVNSYSTDIMGISSVGAGASTCWWVTKNADGYVDADAEL